MSASNFLETLDQHPLLSDGAMGTLLNARGIDFERCFDELNLTQPALISAIHKEYIQAGADIIQTNTFGANRFKLERHGMQNEVQRINQLGVELARQAISDSQSSHPVYLAGDVGPLGVHIAPYGRVQPEQAEQAFKEQMSALVEAGADLLIIETISDVLEMEVAVKAAKEVRRNLNISLPICASMTFTRDDRTLLGDDPASVAVALQKAGADVIGVNCSGGPAQLLRLLKTMRQSSSLIRLMVQPNAGWPEQAGGRIMYPADPPYFGRYAQAFCEAGAVLIGGCCGTTPDHTHAMRQAMDENPQGCNTLETVIHLSEEPGDNHLPGELTSQLAQRLSGDHFAIAVEMDPPRGISTHKLVAAASLLAEAGADVIDVADSPMARMRMSAWAVCNVIQAQAGIETTLHFPTRGRNLLRVQGDLLAAHALGIRNVFVVMGDPTAIGDYPEAMDNYDLVPSGLIKLIKQGFNSGMDHAGTSIGQPTSFFVGCALNLNPTNAEKEIQNLHRKVMAGADFLLTQPIYSSEAGPLFLERYEKVHGKLDLPILAGVLPLVSLKHATFLNNEVPGIHIPIEVLQKLEEAGENGWRIGERIAVDLVDHIKGWAQGIYLMPQFQRYDLVADIIEAIKE